MDLEKRATSWFDCFNETRKLLLKSASSGKDAYHAKYHALALMEVERASWTDHFDKHHGRGQWFVQDWLLAKRDSFEQYKDSPEMQHWLANRLVGADDIDLVFAYATYAISREVAIRRQSLHRPIERGLYICFEKDMVYVGTERGSRIGRTG
jgi:hypothetical protein